MLEEEAHRKNQPLGVTILERRGMVTPSHRRGPMAPTAAYPRGHGRSGSSRKHQEMYGRGLGFLPEPGSYNESGIITGDRVPQQSARHRRAS